MQHGMACATVTHWSNMCMPLGSWCVWVVVTNGVTGAGNPAEEALSHTCACTSKLVVVTSGVCPLAAVA
jgi:hypothetical protein